MKNHYISVIIPVYKVEKYLDRCVESIVNQTYKNLEIILVDDGSPDNCPQMCDEWAEKDNRIKVIHKENGGVSSARNAGIESAKGDYISFVDSDDWIDFDLVYHLLKLAIENNYDVVSCLFEETYDSNLNKAADKRNEIITVLSNDEIMGKMDKGLCYLCGKLYRRSLFNNIPCLPENLSVSEDMMLNYFVYKNCSKLAITNLKLYYYFRHSQSVLSGKITYRIIDDSMQAYKIMEDDCNKNSNIYSDFVYCKVMNDFFLLNSIIRNQACIDRYSDLRKDILKYKKYILGTKGRKKYAFRHIFGTLLLMVSPHLYNLSIELRKKLRGY